MSTQLEFDRVGYMPVNYSDLSTAELLFRARQIKIKQFGKAITFSPKVFIPLTMLCRDRCGYCTFAKAPRQLSHPYQSLDEVVQIAEDGERYGCTEALFTLGEKPELRYPAAAEFLAELGMTSTTEYLHRAAQAVLENTSLIPHLNAGALTVQEFSYLKDVSASQGMMRFMCLALTRDTGRERSPSRRPLTAWALSFPLVVIITSSALDIAWRLKVSRQYGFLPLGS